MSRVLLIGWDAADWKVINPLIRAGQMPNLQRLMAQGVHGNLATIYPILSPMLWTSIATGKRAYKHGIHGFTEPLPDGSGVRPISILARKTKAVWNILNQNGKRSIVVGWWPSHPAEPLNGVMVSNHFQPPPSKPDKRPPMPAGTIHPPELAASLSELRVNPMELTGEFIRAFVPEYDKIDQSKDKRLHSLGKIIAETMSIHAVATELLETQAWDFAAIYYSGIDHFGHGFMSYHPPRLPWISEEDFAVYQQVVTNAYRYHDAMLGALLEYTDQDTTVILMSDHGFHPDEHRPDYIPAEPAGPAVEHRHFGIFCMKGPQIRQNERVFGAGILDVCPTILSLYGLPPGKDMDGKVLVNAFAQDGRNPKDPLSPSKGERGVLADGHHGDRQAVNNGAPVLEPIPSWDEVPGDAGTHRPEAQVDAAASAEAFKQLVELGYVAPPGPNVQETVDECVRELRYNLARAYRDGDYCKEAAELAEQLWERWPKEHRFGLLLLDCLGPMNELARRREAIEELGRRVARYQAEARGELERWKEQPKTDDPIANQRRQFELRQLRELAAGRPLLLEWYLVTQALLEQRPEEARKLLRELSEAESPSVGFDFRMAGALAELGDLEPARELLERVIAEDPDHALAHGRLAGVHFQAGRMEEAIAAATESLSLMYFQPSLHALLGNALMKMGRHSEAEQELRVAVAQAPRHLAAHEALAKLYREHLNRPADAFPHEGRAQALRNELAAQEGKKPESIAVEANVKPQGKPGAGIPRGEGESADGHDLPADFGSAVEPGQIVTVVSGLPRSGTSMMMQILAAGGREVLTDSKRAADEDNPRGYFEFEKATELTKDVSWLPQARGKVVKIVAQLLPFLPRGEHYQVVFMERDLDEVVASQNTMLARQARKGAELESAKLAEVYERQLERVENQLFRRKDVRVLKLKYGAVVAEPRQAIERLARFVGGALDLEKAIAAVHPELKRQGTAS